MNDTFSLFPRGRFPVYTSSADSGHTSVCQGGVLSTGYRSSPPSGRKPGPTLTSTRLGRS